MQVLLSAQFHTFVEAMAHKKYWITEVVAANKKQKAPFQDRKEALVLYLPWHRAIFPWSDPQSIFVAATFHHWVRDGVSVEPEALVAPGKS